MKAHTHTVQSAVWFSEISRKLSGKVSIIAPAAAVKSAHHGMAAVAPVVQRYAEKVSFLGTLTTQPNTHGILGRAIIRVVVAKLAA
jgi:hypothetical protein